MSALTQAEKAAAYDKSRQRSREKQRQYKAKKKASGIVQVSFWVPEYQKEIIAGVLGTVGQIGPGEAWIIGKWDAAKQNYAILQEFNIAGKSKAAPAQTPGHGQGGGMPR
jgi:hypothetical protein